VADSSHGSDLALAQITAKWRGALKTFQAFQEPCATVGFDLDLGLHLKNLVIFATGQSRFLTVINLPVETLKQAWTECVPGMEFALNFIKSNGNIDSLASLSSPFLLVTLGYYGHSGSTSSGPRRPIVSGIGCCSRTPRDAIRAGQARRCWTRISRPYARTSARTN
jgi:hypothetical protein